MIYKYIYIYIYMGSEQILLFCHPLPVCRPCFRKVIKLRQELEQKENEIKTQVKQAGEALGLEDVSKRANLIRGDDMVHTMGCLSLSAPITMFRPRCSSLLQDNM